ncbi:MAG: hypothetical protein JWN78_2464 [Bacteroidota bacterium]|nr:hypothetical protein [Bacteroidota bacterium]
MDHKYHITQTMKTLGKIVLLFCGGTLLFYSCLKKPVESVQRKIKQSNKVYDDNVNGRRAGGNIEESNNFFYNSDGTLNKVTVYDDTTPTATLLKQLDFDYLPDRVVAHTYNSTAGYRLLQFVFNSKKQIIQLIDSLGNGLYITYTDDKITRIRDSSGVGINDFVNFIYDASNNLLQYELMINGNPPIGRATLEYSTDKIPSELDTRFFSKDINFIYIGGLNLVTKLGLNLGIDNENTLIKRTETALATSQVVEVYNFRYFYNTSHEIIKRNMSWSTDTLFYQFKY